MFVVIFKLRKVIRPFEDFFRDWNGEEARPGVDARPGVMPRLSSIEEHLKDAPTKEQFKKLESRVTRNTTVIDLIVPRISAALDIDDSGEI